MEDFDELMRMLMRGSQRRQKLGRKVATLLPDEAMMLESINLKKRDLYKGQLDSIKLDFEDNEIQRKKWWRAVEAKYKLSDNLTVKNGAVYQLKDDEGPRGSDE